METGLGRMFVEVANYREGVVLMRTEQLLGLDDEDEMREVAGLTHSGVNRVSVEGKRIRLDIDTSLAKGDPDSAISVWILEGIVEHFLRRL